MHGDTQYPNEGFIPLPTCGRHEFERLELWSSLSESAAFRSTFLLGLTRPESHARLRGCQLNSCLGSQAQDAREVQELHDVQTAGTSFHGGEPLLRPTERRSKGRLGYTRGFPNFPQLANQSPIRRGINSLGNHDRTKGGDRGIYGTITDYMKFMWNLIG